MNEIILKLKLSDYDRMKRFFYDEIELAHGCFSKPEDEYPIYEDCVELLEVLKSGIVKVVRT